MATRNNDVFDQAIIKFRFLSCNFQDFLPIMSELIKSNYHLRNTLSEILMHEKIRKGTFISIHSKKRRKKQTEDYNEELQNKR